jgi:hypothetical protein
MADRKDTDHEPIRRDVRRRDDGVVVVTEDDPETRERIERKYPVTVLARAVMRQSDRR